jgi:hypothetical protein
MIATLVERIHVTCVPAPRVMLAAGAAAFDGTAAAVGWMRRTWCGLGGHEMIRRFDGNRISLECMSCGEQSPGWSIDPR